MGFGFSWKLFELLITCFHEKTNSRYMTNQVKVVYLLMSSSSKQWHWFKEMKFRNLELILFSWMDVVNSSLAIEIWNFIQNTIYNFIFSLGQPASTTVVVSSVATSTTTAQGVSGVSPPKKSRIPPDPNRVPKYHDERLPAGKIFFVCLFH